MNTPQPLEQSELLQYLEGEVSAARAREIATQLGWCQVSQQRLTELNQLLEQVAAPPAELVELDLVADVQRAIDRQHATAGMAGGRARQRWLYGGVATALAMAAGLLLALWLRPAGDGFATKGGSVQTAERWAGIKVWRVDRSGAVAALGTTMQADDALLFSYSNSGPDPFGYLMIFGVDQRGRVFWYHPAFTDAATDPAALPIQGGQVDVELTEQVRHELGTGRLTLYGLFTRQPLGVKIVEQEVARLRSVAVGGGASTAPRLGFDRSAQHLVEVEVVP